MKRIVQPTKHQYGNRKVNGYVEIEFDRNGRLSMHGVIGPKANGNSFGSAGQCIDEIRNGEPADGWTPEMVNQLCDIWEDWHLDDMRPYCSHQKELGWDKLAKETVTLYHYKMRRAIVKEQHAVQELALSALRRGEVFAPTDHQAAVAAMPYFVTLHAESTDPEFLRCYEPRTVLLWGDTPGTEVKQLGWLRPDDHPRGLLGKACPVCGFKYGSGFQCEPVPKEIIAWLKALPVSKTQPAWI